MTEKEEKRQARRQRTEQLAALPAREKWQYFKDYYLKGTVLGILALIMMIGLGRDIWKGSRESVFYALVINNYTAVPEAFREDFIAYAGLDDKKYNIIIDTTMQIDLARRDDMTNNYMQEIIAISSTRKQDIFLADQQVVDYYWDTDYIVDLRQALPETVWLAYEDRFYYRADPDGNEVPVGIFVTDSPKLAEYGMYEYQQPIVSVVYQAPDTEQIEVFLSFLYS